MIENAVSTLANTMRIYGEAHMKFGALFKIDPEEAINNADRAFEMKLEAFHSLYDVSKDLFPYFDHGDTTLIITIRNAIHHRNHPLFLSLNRRLHLEKGGLARWLGATILLASHPTRHGARIPMSHYVRLDDIDARVDPCLRSPYLDTFVSSTKAIERLTLIDHQLRLSKLRKIRTQHGYPDDQTYLDLVPIFISAVCKVFCAMKAAGISFSGFDAQAYQSPFTSEIDIDLSNPCFEKLSLRGWGSLDLIPTPVD